ncbi:MAG: carboxymuconolactone decarboxylase family protein [Microthrixaceae bacterium]
MIGDESDPSGGGGGRDPGSDLAGGSVAGASAERFARGAAKLREVYAGDVVDLPEGFMAFNDVMVRSLFAEVWARDVLDIRSRRLLLMGVIAAHGQTDVWRIQARASLVRRELTPDELRETLVALAPYAGYPNVSGLVRACEEVIATWIADGEPAYGD